LFKGIVDQNNRKEGEKRDKNYWGNSGKREKIKQ